MAGRPKKPKDQKRDKYIRIMLTDKEHAAIEQFAQAIGRDTSTWARDVLLAKTRKPPKKDKR